MGQLDGPINLQGLEGVLSKKIGLVFLPVLFAFRNSLFNFLWYFLILIIRLDKKNQKSIQILTEVYTISYKTTKIPQITGV